MYILIMTTKIFFSSTEGVVGDITPAYYFLKPETIKEIKKTYPDVKIIVILREPIDRLWSNVKHVIRRRGSDASSEQVTQILSELSTYSLSYPYNGLKNWLDAFDSDQFFIGFYDELKDDTILLYKRICMFLGLSDQLDSVFRPVDMVKKRTIKGELRSYKLDTPEALISFSFKSSTIDLEMTDEIRYELAELFMPQVYKLSELVDSDHIRDWLKKYELILNNNA